MFNPEKLIRKNILALKSYSSARDEYKGKEGIFLDANENPFGELNRYPDPYQLELKNKIGLLKGADHRNIFIGNGSDEAIDLIYRIFCEPGKSAALIFTPTYGMYEVSAAVNDVELLTVPLNDQFQINRQAVSEVLFNKAIRVIFVCSPNNPTGNCINDIAFLCEQFKGIIVVDEAYADFTDKPSWILSIQNYPNLIVLQTLSKAYGLAAARIGLAFAHEYVIEIFNKVKAPYNISALNQQAALLALADNETYEKQRRLILFEKNRLYRELEELSFVQHEYPSDANFILIKLKDATQCFDYLISKKIIVRNRSSVVEDCLRITVGTQNENDLLIQTLKKYATEKSIIY